MGRISQTALIGTSYTSLNLAELNSEMEKRTKRSFYMASAWRVVAFFLVVFVVPVVLIALPLYARYTLYPARSLALVAADTFDLHQLASTFWCQGQRMSSNGTFDAYLLPRAPELDTKKRKITTASKTLLITEEAPEFRMVHLLKGSSFSLGVCARWPGGTVIVVRGAENFKRCYYKEDVDWEDLQKLPDKKHRIQPTLRHTRTTTPPTRSGRVKSILPISDVDLVSDAESDGREIFDDVDDNFIPNSQSETWVIAADPEGAETTTIRFPDTTSPQDASSVTNEVSYTTKTTFEPSTRKRLQNPPSTRSRNTASARVTLQSSSSVQTGKPRKRNKNHDKEMKGEPLTSNVIDEAKPENDSRMLRVLRSITSQHDPADDSHKKKKREEEEARILRMLHSIDNRRDVTAGNSSISSSEEFMKNCDNTILYFEVNSLVDCLTRDVSQSVEQQLLHINETDDYYFLFMSDNSLEENIIKYYLKLDRVMYDVSENTDTCNNSSECSFPLGFLGSEAVVVEMIEQNGDGNSSGRVLTDLNSYEVQAVCQPRVAVYMIFILMVPFIILLFAFQ